MPLIQSMLLAFGPNTHDHVIEQMKALGYNVESDGVCSGLTQMWIQAVLVDDERKFQERLFLLSSIPPNQIAKLIDDVKEKIKHNTKLTNLTDKERQLLELLPFFEGVYLAQTPKKFPEVFGAKINQDNVESIAKITAPLSFESKGQLKSINMHTGIFTEKELNKHLAQLGDIFSKYPSMKIPISLSCYEHTIGLHFDVKTKTWSIFDANTMPFLMTTKHPGKYIMNAMEESPVTVLRFSINSVTEGMNPSIKADLDQLKRSYLVTSEMCQRKTKSGSTLLSMSGEGNDVDTVRKIGACGVDLSKPTSSGFSLLHYAFAHKSTEMIFALKENGVDLNKTILIAKAPFVPIGFAASINDVQMIRALRACGVNINKKNNEGNSAVFDACCNVREDCLRTLILLGADLTQTDRENRPLVVSAIRDNNPQMLQLIGTCAPSLIIQASKEYDLHAYAMRKGASNLIPILDHFEKLAVNHDFKARLSNIKTTLEPEENNASHSLN